MKGRRASVSNVTRMGIRLPRLIAAIGVAGTLALVGILPVPTAGSANAATTIERSSPLCIRRKTPPRIGLTYLGSKPLTDRVSEVTFRSEALNGAVVAASVLLPANYDPTGATRYPVLYLFHGRSGDHLDWYRKGGIAAVDQPVITVMPDAGTVGWHADWMGEERFGPDKGKPAPAWETFHIRELIPWIDAHYPTRTDRAGRSIAGLSMGGYGAVLYAARHPEVFGVAGSLSGQLDMLAGYPFIPLAQAYAGNLFELAPPDPCVWGDPVLERVVWEDHSPFQLYPNLRGVKVFLAAGNGIPLKPNTDPIELATEIVGEVAFRRMAQGLAKRLDSVGVTYRTHYTKGGHGWSLWPRQLAALYPFILETAHSVQAAATPAEFSYRSAESHFAAWDWSFSVSRAVREFMYLDAVGRNGLIASGSGSLDVTTAGLYTPGHAYTVHFDAAESQVVTADGQGRLHFTVDLGPSNLVQQVRFDAAARSEFPSVTVAIVPAG